MLEHATERNPLAARSRQMLCARVIGYMTIARRCERRFCTVVNRGYCCAYTRRVHTSRGIPIPRDRMWQQYSNRLAGTCKATSTVSATAMRAYCQTASCVLQTGSSQRNLVLLMTIALYWKVMLSHALGSRPNSRASSMKSTSSRR